ncbi:MAG: rod shape-determining protein RodA [Candidatus Omnitrophica bacterium]|nr:rod shape-determining protein RodA [Candidatus Omnitrophota bacterium]
MSSKFSILLVALLIAFLGILSIYSSTYQKEGQLWKAIYRRQMLWVILGILLFFLFSNFNYRRLWDATYFLYALAILLLVLVFILGIVRLGAQRWLRIAWFNFQPSEITKLIMIIFLSRYFSKKSVDNISPVASRLDIWKGLITPFIFTIVPIGFIIEQPDLGSAAIIFFMFIAMLYLGGIKVRYLLIFFGIIILFSPLFWYLLRGYQRERLMVFLNPSLDPLGAGYTVIQSKIAIGSGGLFGKGYLCGTQSSLRFLPESHTDFIFGTFAEERGFFGSCLLLFLYYFLISKGMAIAERANDEFGKLLSLGISLLLSTQTFINIAMNLGLAPVVGLPLPLMSYGGSSVLTTFIALGILANIDKRR